MIAINLHVIGDVFKLFVVLIHTLYIECSQLSVQNS